MINNSEVQKILQNNNKNPVVEQMLQLAQHEARIEQELNVKKAYINKLQVYLKNELGNIQMIIEENNKLKQLLEIQKIELQNKNKIIQQYEHKQIKEKQKYKNRLQISTQTTNNSHQNDFQIKQMAKQINSLKQENQNLKKIQSNSHITSIQQKQQQITTADILELINNNKLIQLKFRGTVVEGVRQGKAEVQYKNKLIYEGQFVNGLFHGVGTLYYENQIFFRGFWQKGLMHGKGILKMRQSQIQCYQGQFKQGKMQGLGSVKLKSGKVIMAKWRQGRIVGKCIQTQQNTIKYKHAQTIQCC